jgi:uncharacterized DUF497 family protein
VYAQKHLIPPVIVHTLIGMEITFDPDKDVANVAKHGVSLSLAAELDWEWLLVKPDTRRDYGEMRMVGYAPIGSRVFCVVFTDRSEERRMISLRKANTREVKYYASQI